MIVLGIETSCDETAAALVTDRREILKSLVLSQLEEHAPYGGIVPEIAARAHIDHLDGLIARTMEHVGIQFKDLDGVAVTAGPGLIGAVMVGLMTGKALSAVHELDFSAVNHLEGHALSARLCDHDLTFPYLLLLVSGGHCQLLIVNGVANYKRLGTTVDDAAGEAFDKAAKLLNLGYPGGPAIEKASEMGDGKRFALPRPLLGRAGCNFSFSGLKTSLLHKTQSLGDNLTASTRMDLAASFQSAVVDVIVDRCQHAINMYRKIHPTGNFLVAGGGVVANSALRSKLECLARKNELQLSLPPLSLCTDNAAMIAWAGIERLKLGFKENLNFAPRARWPLDLSAEPPPGAGPVGKLGPKA